MLLNMIKKNKDVGQMILDIHEKLKVKKVDHAIHLELLPKLIIRNNFSHKFFEYPKLRTWINYL